jgi:hypothetical protein
MLRSWSKSSHPTANVLAWLAVYYDEEQRIENNEQTAKQNKNIVVLDIMNCTYLDTTLA